MEIGYIHNIVSGRRNNRKITKFGYFLNLTDRIWAETIALNKYLKRVHQNKI